MVARPIDTDPSVEDEAARAGWMYYVGGQTQDQIAAELGVSRQRAQRLVARAMTDGLIRVRIEHPIAKCLELERALRRKFGLGLCRVAPSLADGIDPVKAIAPVAAGEIERIFSTADPLVIALGTGRTLRAVVDEIKPMDCRRHKVVSLIGNVAPDGSASFFEVIMRVADKTQAPHYPMAVPVIADDAQDREHYHALPHVKNTRKLALGADYTIVGIGQIGEDAPLYVDGFVSKEELLEMSEAGAIGELVGWTFDKDGTYLNVGINSRVNGVCVPQNGNPVICIAAGASKCGPLRAALEGGLISGL
ncbi:MAG: sugar-binding transcriptional regulator, partial [Paracoccaceae bacterium]